LILLIHRALRWGELALRPSLSSLLSSRKCTLALTLTPGSDITKTLHRARRIGASGGQLGGRHFGVSATKSVSGQPTRVHQPAPQLHVVRAQKLASIAQAGFDERVDFALIAAKAIGQTSPADRKRKVALGWAQQPKAHTLLDHHVAKLSKRMEFNVRHGASCHIAGPFALGKGPYQSPIRALATKSCDRWLR
jgi:hypothetical protein